MLLIARRSRPRADRTARREFAPLALVIAVLMGVTSARCQSSSAPDATFESLDVVQTATDAAPDTGSTPGVDVPTDITTMPGPDAGVPSGWIAVSVDTDPSGTMVTVASARFGFFPTQPCHVRVDGACRVAVCTDGNAAPLDLTPQLTGSFSAGNIAITGGSVGAITLDPAQSYLHVANGAGFVAGDGIHINAMGAVVPAFSASVTFPPAIQGLSPLPDGGPLVIPRQSGLHFTWTPLAADVVIALHQTQAYRDGGSQGFSTVCRFHGADGAGTIAPTALSDFGPSGFEITEHLVAFPVASVDLAAGGYAITAIAQSTSITVPAHYQ